MGDVAKPDRNASSSAMPAMPISDRCRVVCGISPGAEQRSMDNTRARSQKALHARCALLTPADNTKVFRLCDVFTAVTRHRGPAAHMGSRSVAFCVRSRYCLCTLRAIYRARRTVASWGVCAGDCYADWATVGESEGRQLCGALWVSLRVRLPVVCGFLVFWKAWRVRFSVLQEGVGPVGTGVSVPWHSELRQEQARGWSQAGVVAHSCSVHMRSYF